ncbi:MAG TPA: hypothetical protein VF665_21990 [Longimicrobium sp.]|jgi:hypothetical protein|uniref:hypothetical protein n=1 Tax=Longimicrobium sp. TaxID=2029185 RepID=UPI002EDBB85C
MKYAGAEDRLNPIAPPDADEGTLGGYMAIYGRAAAFEGMDGDPYTVGLETDETGDADRPFAGYLVFIRWARTGTAVMGHMETGDLVHGGTEAEARAGLEAMPLATARALLDETIARKRADADGFRPPAPDPDREAD